jgi:predicted RecB family nuclease
LKTWTYPISYFDLEAISYPIPRYNNSRPYQDLPFQFSCHIQRLPEAELEHHEFLFDADTDPREAFINEMLKVLPSVGSIVVYHQTYEITKLNELAKDFPQYTASINALLPRIVDLKKVIEESVYHPEFLGSYSIKKVAPVLLGQGVSYDHLAVGDGMEAVCKFQELVKLDLNDSRRDAVRKDLLEYCKQDTLLMAELKHWLIFKNNSLKENS